MIVVHSVGPYRGIEVFWGVEYDLAASDRSVLARSWLVEDLEPYRRSTWAFRIRFRDTGLHFGRCVRASDPHRRLPEIPVSDISKWRGPHDVQEEGAADPGGEPLRPTGLPGAVHDVGGELGNGDASRRRVPAVAGTSEGTEPAPDRA